MGGLASLREFALTAGLGSFLLAALVLGLLSASHRWARRTAMVAAVLLALALAAAGLSVARSEGEARLIGQAALLALFLPAAGVVGLLYGLGFLAARALGRRRRTASEGRP